MRIHAFVGVAAAVLAGAVTGHSQVPAAGRAAQPSTRPAVTFAETIAPIVYANCVTCHRPGEAAPFSLITYEDVVKRGKLDRPRDGPTSTCRPGTPLRGMASSSVSGG